MRRPNAEKIWRNGSAVSCGCRRQPTKLIANNTRQRRQDSPRAAETRRDGQRRQGTKGLAVEMADFTSQLKSRVSALAENAREITLDFDAASGSRFFDNDEQTMKDVHTLLAGRLDREKLEALRRLVAVLLPSAIPLSLLLIGS
jgi:hypothetical protein